MLRSFIVSFQRPDKVPGFSVKKIHKKAMRHVSLANAYQMLKENS